MEILEECPSDWDYLQYAERYWIMSLKDFGHNLLNHTDGGGGTRGMALSENHKELIKLGVSRHFAENGQKSVYEYWVDHYGVVEADRRWNALKEKKSIAMSGEGNHMYGKTGQSAPCYGRVGVKHPMFGTHHSDEARARISASTTGRPKSEITKIRMSYANHIRHHSVKVKSTCKWCLGADLQIEIKKRELELNGEKVE